MPSRPRSRIQTELQQTRPFRSARQEATIALLRTASVVGRTIARVLEPHGMTVPQYNALRIIRGAGPTGVPTLTIRERMIEEGTTITRLLDKLESAGLIRRDRQMPDRRQVLCFVTAKGKKVLDQLDPLVNQADDDVMTALHGRRLNDFIAALDDIRAANAERGAPRTMVRATT